MHKLVRCNLVWAESIQEYQYRLYAHYQYNLFFIVLYAHVQIYICVSYVYTCAGLHQQYETPHEYNNNYNSYPTIIGYDYSLLRLNVYHYSFLHSTHIIIVIRIYPLTTTIIIFVASITKLTIDSREID